MGLRLFTSPGKSHSDRGFRQVSVLSEVIGGGRLPQHAMQSGLCNTNSCHMTLTLAISHARNKNKTQKMIEPRRRGPRDGPLAVGSVVASRASGRTRSHPALLGRWYHQAIFGSAEVAVGRKASCRQGGGERAQVTDTAPADLTSRAP